MVFATASFQSVRIWSLTKKIELLRIVVPNFTAAAVLFSFDGKSIITAWNDGVIRAFTPLSGKLLYAIPNAHSKGNFTAFYSPISMIYFRRFNRLFGSCIIQIRQIAYFWRLRRTN